MLAMATKLKAYRNEIGLIQKDFAAEASMPFETYRNIEQGRDTTYTTAKHILSILNELRMKHEPSLPPVTLDDLELNIV